jgi:SWIM zinc finger
MHEMEKDILYEVNKIPDPTIPNWKTVSFHVCVNKANSEVSCTCQGFEFEGLLCSHSLKVMQNLGMHLHPRYVLSRWTKEANQGVKRYCNDMSYQVLSSDADR